MSMLLDHLATGATHVCQCWRIVRHDGVSFGFTDHDLPLTFEGVDFRPESGLAASALSSTTGLSVNNAEAIGVLSAVAITDADIDAGRYDGAQVTHWLVQWDDVAARQVRFVGTFGEISRQNGSFHVELRGLTDALNQPQGRSYVRTCGAVLGDVRCGVALEPVPFAVADVTDAQVFMLPAGDRPSGWFADGLLHLPDAALTAVIKADVVEGVQRRVTLWQPVAAVEDVVHLTPGCDKRAQTCRAKFANMVNFQGFTDIPGDDWLMAGGR